MVDTKAKAPAKPVATDAKKEGVKQRGKPRNRDLGNGVYRFSRTRMYHKKAIYKFVGKTTEKTVKPKKPIAIEKKIGGEKNGGTRLVLLKKRRKSYPTSDPVTVHHAKKTFRDHVRKFRPTLVPGTILILLAGAHKGKRVVLLKRLKSGLLLVTGPFLINACPLRRVSQNYVIATSTRINLSGVKFPKEVVKDEYYKRTHHKRAKKAEGDIFSTKKVDYKPSEQRKIDQKVVDKLVIGAIKKHQDKKLLFTYLSAMFGLRSSQYPHRMKF
ncbi:60S ribosomal protein L6 [Athalia rosae]|uniref:60S ribosomal protein L6 n=1 Tax=Athalia rosae TaxID=37344 RepID=UPI000625EA05|nr:60S ribosomal protein L6 [Athalia rosae]XP_012250753.1 60S ribosomal protein L6 [Athalia rosae]